MKKIIPLIFALLSLDGYCRDIETIDTARIKCSYEYKYMMDTTVRGQENYAKDILYLQIGATHSKCYSYYTRQSDSIEANGGLEEAFRRVFLEADKKGWGKKEIYGALPRRRLKTEVYKDFARCEMTVTDRILSQFYTYSDSINNQEWTICGDSAKNVLGHECQMATCRFRGRDWTAWFALDIPISDGPWKFCGLPGLIMEVYDSQREQYFCINGLSEVEAEPIYYGVMGKDLGVFQKVKRKDLLKTQYKFLRDPKSFIEMSAGMSFSFMTSSEATHDLLERME